jgi:iron complex outermembrane receptor protein
MSQRAGFIASVSGVTLIAALGATAAQSQTTPPGAAPGSQISEVIVTAQRRSERLNEVPIAITVRNADQLERAGVTNLRDLTTVTPGLRVSGTGANAQPAIRGIHSEQVDPGNDANVAIYLDGVYQSNQLANNMDLPDVERVEVLKGPQGTLFGRNATGGAIRIITKRPSFAPTGLLDVSYGKLNEASVKVFASGPIVADKLAASVSGYYQRRDGFTTDIVRNKKVGGLDSKNVRLKLLAKPTEDIDVTLTGGYSSRRDADAVLYQPLGGNTVARFFPGAVITPAPRQVALNPGRDPAVNAQVYSSALTVDWRTEAGTLTSTSAYIHYKTNYDTDADFTQLNLVDYPIYVSQRDLSEELTFSSKQYGMAQFVVGGFVYDGDGSYDPLIVAGTLINPTLYGFLRQQTKAYAAFTEVTLTPVERLNIILGARYSEEKRHATGNYFLSPVEPASLPELGKAKFSSFTPRISVRYTLPSDDNLYATYSRGFKSGGFNISGVSNSPFQPEKVDAFEVGLKTSPRRPVSANVSAFYYKYKNQQVLSAVNGLNVTANAASSNIKGVDIELVATPAEGLTLTAGAAYLHAKFDRYPAAVVNSPTGGPACRCGNFTDTVNLSGGQEPFSPKFTIGGTADYRTALAQGEIDLSVSVYHTSRSFFDPNARVEQPAYTTLAARASYTPEGTKFTVYAYGRNLTNERYINTTFINNLGDGATYTLPRTFGVGAKYAF